MRKNKIINIFLIGILFLFIFKTNVMGQTLNQKLDVIINDNYTVSIDDYKVINNQIYIPMRSFFESLNQNVNWNNKLRVAESTFMDKKIGFVVNSENIIVNNQNKTIKEEIKIIDKKTYIPIVEVLRSIGIKSNVEKNNLFIEINEYPALEYNEEEIIKFNDMEAIRSVLGKEKRVLVSLYNTKDYIFKNKDILSLVAKEEKGEVIELTSNSKDISIGDIKVGDTYNKEKLDRANRYYNMLGYNLDAKKIDEGNIVSFVKLEKIDSLNNMSLLKTNKKIEILYTEEVLNSYEDLVFEYINNYRINNKKSLLSKDDTLREFSNRHNKEMIKYNYFSHDSIEKGSYYNRVTDLLKSNNYSLIAENIAAGIFTPDEVINEWLNSKVHRENILNDFDKIGISINYALKSRYGLYFTTNFAKEN